MQTLFLRWTPSRRAALLLGSGVLLAASGCGDDEKKPIGDGVEIGGDDISLGSGGTKADPLPPSFEGGRTDLTHEQVQAILEAECTGWAGEGENLPATLEIVVDVSGSMNLQPPGSEDGPSKWEITRSALASAVAALPPSVAMGVLYYPNRTVSSNSREAPGPTSDCVNVDRAVPIGRLGQEGSAQRTAFSESLSLVMVDSYTATHDAYAYALTEHLVPFSGPNKFVLLITDGAPTIELGCVWPVEPAHVGLTEYGIGSYNSETAPIVADVENALLTHGVRTFVIGAPGSQESENNQEDMRPWLSEAALMGGTAPPGCSIEGPDYCHFDMTESTNFASELREGLATIAATIVNRCTYEIPSAAGDQYIDPSLTQVLIEWGDGSNSLIHGDGEDPCSDGWVFDPNSGAIQLCSETCAAVEADDDARIRLSFGCSQEDVDVLVR